MLAEADRLDRLVGDLLDLARLGADDFRLDLVPRRPDRAGRSDAGEVVAGPLRRRRRVGSATELPPAPGAGAHRPDPGPPGRSTASPRTRCGSPRPGGRRARPSADAGARAVARGPRRRPGADRRGPAGRFERSALYDRYRGVRQVGTGFGLALVHGLTRPARRHRGGRPGPGGRRLLHRAAAAGTGSGRRRPALPWGRVGSARRRSVGCRRAANRGTSVSVLDEILDGVRADLAEREARVQLAELKAAAAAAPARATRWPRCAPRASGSSPR